MKSFGFYFIALGIFGIATAFARAKNEREVYLILATIPTAFLVIRGAEFLRKKNNERYQPRGEPRTPSSAASGGVLDPKENK